MDLEQQVQQVFAPDGVLARNSSQFVPRQAQTEMAAAVARAIEHEHALVVEAGTGVGKTFAYLVPALLSAQRVLLSTATKALQDQLFGRDVPALIKMLGLPVRTALLKGRSSYLCLHRLELARHDATTQNKISSQTLTKIERWAQGTRSGDLAELPGLDERSELITLVTSTRENCLGSQCPQAKACHVNLARQEALAADLVVINHHLFFADLAVKESGVAQLLPSVRIAIFDEAHQLNETGVNFLGKNLSTGQLVDFSRDLLAAGLQWARGLQDWQALAAGVDRAARELRLCAEEVYPGSKLRWVDAVPESLDAPLWHKTLADVQAACQLASQVLQQAHEIAPDFVRLHERAQTLVEHVQGFTQACADGCVRWVDVSMQLRLVEAPLDIAKTIESKVWTQAEAASTHVHPQAWVFTSATLGDDEQLSWFTRPCGLTRAQTLRVGSPFDYARQAALYIPNHFPPPGHPTHAREVAQLAVQGARCLGGRTLVLTTTLRALRAIGQALQTAFEAEPGIEVLIQGQGPKRALIERFRQGDAMGQAACILVASASFWEGIDVPGDALQLVIIDKLPFPPPDDPMVEARAKLLQTQGLSPFADYSLPEAAVALKQGVGRLIRQETDQGVVVVCDNRLARMGYGRRLLKALPPMQRLANWTQVQERLQALTTPCTKGLALT